jgi:hypothetical protein
MDLIIEVPVVEGSFEDNMTSKVSEPDQKVDDETVTLFRHDFDAQDSYWHWEIYPGTAATGTMHNGYAFLNLTDNTTVEDNERVIGWGIHPTKGRGTWLYTSMEVKLRCSDNNKLGSDYGGGMRCWGLKQEPEWPKNMLAFLSWSPESNPEVVGFFLEAKVNNSQVLRVPLEVDMTEWHTYKILWEKNNVTFLVDGKVVGTTNSSPCVPMFGDFFLQNLYHGGESNNQAAGFVDIVGNISLQVDYIHLFSGKERFEGWDEEVSRAQQLISEAEGRGINTTDLEQYLAELNETWREGFYNYEFAKPHLEKIIPYLENYDEIIEMFSQCTELIEENEGGEVSNRTLGMMIGYYNQAVRYWENYEYEVTFLTLHKIIDLAEQRE